MNTGESGVQINHLKESWREARRASKEEDRKILIQKQQKIRKKISEKGPQGSKLFWQCINGKKKGSTIIEALDSGKGHEFDPAKKNKIIEDFFETKLQTSDSPPEQGDDDVREENIGIPPIKLSSTQSWKVTRIVSQKELDTVLDHLNVQKAEGPDEITTSMLKNSGPLARYMILELFNNVLLGGVNPKDWKVGNVILTLKRSPDTDISNYRPITLISCLSKVLSKIIAQRISEAVEESGLAGDLQNGFRKGRNCSDNIFILNSLLEINKDKKMLSYLMFVDLQEAYNR